MHTIYAYQNCYGALSITALGQAHRERDRERETEINFDFDYDDDDDDDVSHKTALTTFVYIE